MTATSKRIIACMVSALLIVSCAFSLTLSQPKVAQADVQSTWDPATGTMVLESDLCGEHGYGDMAYAIDYLLGDTDRGEVKNSL